eukprot:CAMPEP_0198282186 /NCGR_PEP_ID=MMETSP1449-20131203/2033_1 /TAXON_ID=420275 /ORGANISM="Attheya septentrionalis, Strain CCMP2084" /LENGTH=286 /DNA_ID=CAMNT_0043978323 /DNA_START=324 /DNA_END=1181 /DNA_ORIENTATION=+
MPKTRPTKELLELSLNAPLNGTGANPTTNGQVNGNHHGNQKKKYESDLIVVLDMDECLIHSQFLSQHTELSYRQYEERPMTMNNNNSMTQDDDDESSVLMCESFKLSLPDGDLVHVNKRPNLDVFLQEICARFETHIFTAALPVYAEPVLDSLDPTGTLFQRRFYRDSCQLDQELNVYVKDLNSILSRRQHPQETMNGHEPPRSGSMTHNEARMVLIDNNPLSFLANPSNGILVSNFYDDPKDDTLEAVTELLYELDQMEDVRPCLDEKFGLREALHDVVRNNSGW